MTNAALDHFSRHMRTAKLSPVTINDRIELLIRLARWLAPTPLLNATPEALEGFQQSLSHLSRASIDVYTRHVRAFYRWAVAAEMIERDPTNRMVVVRARRGVPDPIAARDLEILLATARGGLRLAYVLAAFAGLRCGEITRLRAEDLALHTAQPTALVHGKGGHERVVPLLAPVVSELEVVLRRRRGQIVRLNDDRFLTPEQLSIRSCKFMAEVGVGSTLHSLRHYFATEVVRMTKDVLLVQQLLGHASLQTTQIYMRVTLDGAHDKLAPLAASATAQMDSRKT